MSGFLICRQHITAYSAVTLQPSYIFLMMSQVIKLTKTIFFFLATKKSVISVIMARLCAQCGSLLMRFRDVGLSFNIFCSHHHQWS